MKLTKTTTATWAIDRDGLAPLTFEGHLVAEVTSQTSGSTRWSELRLYRTTGGNFVAEQIGRSTHKRECDLRAAWVCATQAEVVERLGHGWLAKKLYRIATIQDVGEHVD